MRNRTDETERKVRRLSTEDTEIGAVRAQRLKERRKGLTQRSQGSAEGTESLGDQDMARAHRTRVKNMDGTGESNPRKSRTLKVIR